MLICMALFIFCIISIFCIFCIGWGQHSLTRSRKSWRELWCMQCWKLKWLHFKSMIIYIYIYRYRYRYRKDKYTKQKYNYGCKRIVYIYIYTYLYTYIYIYRRTIPNYDRVYTCVPHVYKHEGNRMRHSEWCIR